MSKKFILVVFAFLMVSSAVIARSETGPDYEAGRIYAREFAKKDVQQFNCRKYPTRGDILKKADTYRETLRNEGKSESFIEGFVYGFQHAAYDYYNAYCRGN